MQRAIITKLFLFINVLLLQVVAPVNAEELLIAYSNDIHGELEPCG
jgi:hypothetical protein